MSNEFLGGLFPKVAAMDIEPRTLSPSRENHFSGVLVRAQPAFAAEVAAAIGRLPGAQVRHRDDAQGHLVVVLEAETLEVHESAVRTMQALPGVAAVDLVMMYRDSEPAAALEAPGRRAVDLGAGA